MSGAVTIEARSLTKRYGSTTAVDDHGLSAWLGLKVFFLYAAVTLVRRDAQPLVGAAF